MKISLERDVLLSQLQTVSRVASTRSAIQALSGVQLTVKQDGCELRATDMDVGLRVPLEAEVTREGTVVLPARLMLDVVRSLPASAVTLELRSAEQDVEVVSGNARFHIRTLRGDDFPPFPEPEPETAVEVPADAFVSTAQKVAGSASRDETRPGEDESLSISVRQNQVLFTIGRVVLSSRLIDGQFPNYRQLLPESFEHELRLAGGEFTDVVRRISLLAQKNAPLRLAFAPGELTVSAQTPDVGEASESLPVAFQGEPLEIGFNPEFLRAGLEAIDEGDVLLKLISPLRPGLIEAADESRFRYLIMPIRLNV